MKSVTVLKEVRPGEGRVALMPREVEAFRAAGFEVLVETGAGENAGVSDASFTDAGAQIVDRETAWSKPYVVKYKSPGPEEFRYFHRDLTLCAFFHAEDQDDLIRAMCESGMTAYSYEFFETDDGIRPMPSTDNQITGTMTIFYGAYLLQTHQGGSGVLLSHVAGAQPAKVLVIGHGDVGASAARTAAALGCDVTVLGRNRPRLRKFEMSAPPNVRCRLNTPEVFDEEVVDADLVVGAILISTYDTPAMLERRHLKMMRKGSLIIDITCGYGPGWMPTFHSQTTHDDPVYEVDGILHCKIDAFPATIPVTASQATSYNMTPHLIDLGNAIFTGEPDPLAETGKIIARGKVLHPVIQRTQALKKSYIPS